MKKVFPLVLCLLLQACALPRALPAATELPADGPQVVVIGKIELVPPLDPRFEQKKHWNVVGEKRVLGNVFIATGGEYKPVDTSRLHVAEFQQMLEVQWGVPFMVKAPRQRTFVNGGVAYLDALHQDRLWFPGGYYFDVPGDAMAVYIGTLRFHRNDFNTITRVEVIDERSDVASVLKTGPPSQVRPSLLKKIR